MSRRFTISYQEKALNKDGTFTRFWYNAWNNLAEFTSGVFVTGVSASSPLTSSGGDTPVIGLNDSPVTPGTYGDATHVAQVTINAKGLVTAASDVIISGGGGGNTTSTGTEAAIPAAGTDGNVYFPTNSFYLQRDNGSVWMPWGPIYPLTMPPASGSWTWINQGGAAISSTRGAVVMSIPVGSSANTFRYVVKAAPATPYTITAAFLIDHYDLDYFISGLFFRQSSDGKLIHCSYANSATGSLRQYLIQKFTNPTTFSANVGTVNRTLSQAGLIWLRITDNGTNRTMAVSPNAYDWTTIYTETRTTFLTADQVGWGVNNYNATYAQTLTLLSWEET